MPIDLGNAPTGTPPTAEEKTQILSALGIPDVSTRSGAENLSNKTLVSPAFSGTASGQLDLPTQIASSAGSVMTRSTYDDRMFFRAGPRVMPLTCFGTAATSGTATSSIVHSNAIALKTNSVDSVAAMIGTHAGGNFNVFGLHGGVVAGGYGGYQWTRDLLWEIPVNITATQAYSGVMRIGADSSFLVTSVIARAAWQIRIEFVNAAGISNVRFCTRLGASSMPNTNASAITNATNASPIVITTLSAHGLTNGETVEVGEVAGNTAANGIWTVANVGTTTFELSGSTGNGTYISSGAVQRVSAPITTGFGTVNRFWVRANAGTASLIIGDDPTATPSVSVSNGVPSINQLTTAFYARLNQTGANPSGFSTPWLIGPVFVSIR